MPDPRTDEIAREAARLIQTGRAAEIPEALRRAADMLGYPGVPLPGHGRVRKHAQAMSMQAMGTAAYEQMQSKVWEIAEQVMTVYEHTMPDVHTLLVGRAAEGQIDAGVTIRIRLYTRSSISRLIEPLIDFGYAEPTFQTIQTQHGRMSQARFDEEGHDIVLTRIVPELRSQAGVSLTTGKPITTLTLDALRRAIDEQI